MAEMYDFADSQPESELTKYYKTEAMLGLKMKSGASYE